MQQAARRLGQPTACVQGGEECRWFACSKPGRGGDILGVSCFKRMHHCHLGGPTSPRQHTVSGRSRASIRLQAEPPHQVLRGLTAQGLLAHVSQGLAAAHRALSPGTSTRLMPCTMANLPARRLARLGITADWLPDVVTRRTMPALPRRTLSLPVLPASRV